MANKTPSSSALYNPALPPSVSKHGFLGMVEKIYEYHYRALGAHPGREAPDEVDDD